MISSTTNSVQFNLSDSTTFPTDPISIPYYFDEDAIHVWDIKGGVSVKLTLNTHYTLSDANDENGGSLILLSRSYTGDSVLLVVSAPDRDQLVEFITNGRFSSETLNDELDRQTLIDQEDARLRNLTLRGASGEKDAWAEITIAQRAGKIQGYDASGQPYFPFSVTELSGGVVGDAPTTTSATPTGLGLSASGRNITVTWTTAGAANWHVVQAYPTGSPTAQLVHWVRGDAGSFTFKVPADGDWVVNVYGADHGKLMSVSALAGTQAVAVPTLAIASVTPGQLNLTVVITAQAGYQSVLQVYEQGSTNFKEITLESGETTAIFEDLATNAHDVRGWHVASVTQERGVTTTNTTGYTPLVFTTTGISGAAGTGGETILDVTWTDAGAGIYVYIAITNSTQTYNSGLIAPESTAYQFVGLVAGTYTGTIKAVEPGVGESSAAAFTITGAVTGETIAAPTGPTITSPADNQLKVAYTPAAGIQTFVQINTNGNEDYTSQWIIAGNTEVTFTGIPAGSYEVRMYNQSTSTGATSTTATFDNSGSYYTVAGTTAGTTDYSPVVPAAPTITAVATADATNSLVILKPSSATYWTYAQLWKHTDSDAFRDIWAAPGAVQVAFREIDDTDLYYVKIYHVNPTGGERSTAVTDNNLGSFYQINSPVARVSQWARIYKQTGTTAQTTNATPGTFDTLINWTGNGAVLGAAVSDYVNSKITLTENGNYIVQFLVQGTVSTGQKVQIRAVKDDGTTVTVLAGTMTEFSSVIGNTNGYFFGRAIFTIEEGTSTDIYLQVTSDTASDSFTFIDGFIGAESINP